MRSASTRAPSAAPSTPLHHPACEAHDHHWNRDQTYSSRNSRHQRREVGRSLGQEPQRSRLDAESHRHPGHSDGAQGERLADHSDPQTSEHCYSEYHQDGQVEGRQRAPVEPVDFHHSSGVYCIH